MASWKEERDRLVAQTLAFVQQVAAAHPAAAQKFGRGSAPHAASVEAGVIAPLPEAIDAPPMIGEPSENPMPTIAGSDELPTTANILADLSDQKSRYTPVSERSDIAGRVAAFKARQMTLHREREEFYDNMQARIRSALRNDTGKAPL